MPPGQPPLPIWRCQRTQSWLSARFCLFLIFVIVLFVPKMDAVAIDNDIIGEPDIECLDQEIRVWVKTRKPFAGRIYAKGKAYDSDCFKDDFAQQRTKKPHFDLPLGMCGMKSLRSFDPRGMYYGITLVISFHPTFITKVDQAFHVKCFFEEANRGLTAELGVSMIPTTEVEARHGIPGCTYSVHKSSIEDLDAGRPAGPAIQFAKVGDKVLHQWHCDDQMFGVLINNCYVTDGVNGKADVIDSRGCPVDQVLISGVRYSDDMQRAYAESQVFKFADRPGLWFFCQVQMCMKKDGMCDGITPPACATRGGGGGSGNGIEDNNDSTTSKHALVRGRHGNKPNSIDEEEEEEENGNAVGAGADEDEELPLPTSRHTHARGGTAGARKPANGGKKPSHVDEEVEEYGTNEDYNTRETYVTRKQPGSKKRVSGARKDYDETDDTGNRSGKKLRVPGYGVPSDLDYEVHAKEPVTIFGPAIALGAESEQKKRSEIVSTEFETDDDLSRARAASALPAPTTASPGSDEEDVSIPPNLTDLLANLPENINADSLQKMFRDSVADRRALLQGFDMLVNKMNKDKSHPKGPQQAVDAKTASPHQKTSGGRMPGDKIDTMHVTWESGRMARDLPLSTDATTALEDPNAPPMIAGQLLIYDLDETPPQTFDGSQEAATAVSLECVISRQGLLVLAMALGSLASVLFFVIVALYFKLRSGSKEDSLLHPSLDSPRSFSKTESIGVFRQALPTRIAGHGGQVSQRRTG